MAKINISVELDWLSEEGGIDEGIQQEIINAITNRVSAGVIAEMTQKAQIIISEKVLSCVDEQVSGITEGLLNKRFNITDKYGDVKQKDVSVLDTLKQRLDNFLEESVDRDGKPTNYNGTRRIDYVISKNIDYSLKSKVDQAAKEVKVGLEKYIETTLKTQIGENVAKVIGLDKMLK